MRTPTIPRSIPVDLPVDARDLAMDRAWGDDFERRETPAGTVIVDDQGREWNSMREAFWRGRLHMAGDQPGWRDTLLECAHALMVAWAINETTGRREQARAHGMLYPYLHTEMFLAWLGSERLLVPSLLPETYELTDEGRTVLVMLETTRPSIVSDRHPSAPTIRQLVSLAVAAADGREARIKAVDAATADWPDRFVRRQVGWQPGVALVSANSEPGRENEAWAMAFADEDDRDAFFDWLAERLDEWEYCGVVGFDGGGRGLSDLLLQWMTATVRAQREEIDRLRSQAHPDGENRREKGE